MTNKKSVGYTGSTPTSAGAFYVPYIPLQISQYGVPTWQDNLRKWTEVYSQYRLTTFQIIDIVWKKMQDQYPGAYSVVIEFRPGCESIELKTRYGPASVKPLQLRLDFANPADETWWRLKYD
jgi:hypothetical protein